MRLPVVLMLLAALFSPALPTAAADPASPILISEARWGSTPSGPTLRIRPTPLGRTYDGADGEALAWSQVLALASNADTPGMRAQFDCHWYYVRAFVPEKPTWNIEPWRPLVDDTAMLLANCNPGGPDV